MSDDDVIDRPRATLSASEAVGLEMERQARQREAAASAEADRVVRFPGTPPAPHPAPAPPPPRADDNTPVAPDQLAPLPLAGSPYTAAHSRIANAPLPTLLIIDAGQLPKGFAYHHLEHDWMVDPAKPGDAPALLLRFCGSDPHEILAEGRDLIGLCDLIGRHLIHWIRQHPTGRDDGTLPVFIRRITIRKIERK